MSLIIDALADKAAHLPAASRYTAFNGLVYLALGFGLILWPGVVQMLLRDRPFVGDEQGLMRAIGLTIAVIGWLYLFGGRSGARQAVAASVVDRLIFVPPVALSLAFAGVFPHLFVAVAILDVSLAVGAWALLNAAAPHESSRPSGALPDSKGGGF